MDAKKLLVVALASLLVSAGAGAAATTGTEATMADTEASVDDYDASATYDNETVTFTVTNDSSAVEGASVSVDGDAVGTTDANGSVTLGVNASETENLTVTVVDGNVTGEFTYTLDNGSLTLVEGGFSIAEADEEEDNETRGVMGAEFSLPGNASDNAKAVVTAINDYFNGESNASTLGEAVSAVAGNAPEDAGKPDDVGPNADEDDRGEGPPEDAGPKGDKDTGKPDDVGPNADEDNDDDDSSGNNGNGNGNNGNGNGNSDE